MRAVVGSIQQALIGGIACRLMDILEIGAETSNANIVPRKTLSTSRPNTSRMCVDKQTRYHIVTGILSLHSGGGNDVRRYITTTSAATRSKSDAYVPDLVKGHLLRCGI